MFIALLVIIILLFVVMFSATSKNTTNANAGASLEILRQRYARGEITREQFDQMKHDLG